MLRPTKVFKLVPGASRLELRSHAQVRTHARARELLIAMLVKQKTKVDVQW